MPLEANEEQLQRVCVNEATVNEATVNFSRRLVSRIHTNHVELATDLPVVFIYFILFYLFIYFYLFLFICVYV